MSKKRIVNKYASSLYDLLRGCYTQILSEEDINKDFLEQAKSHWYKNAVEHFAELCMDSDIHIILSSTGSTATIEVDIPELSTSGNKQYLEIKTAIKIKE